MGNHSPRPYNRRMLTPSLILGVVGLTILLLAVLNRYHTQRSAVISVLHLVSNMVQRQYSRRTDPLVKGAAGELARSANALAEELEKRSARAQQDNDFLVSLLAILDHTNEIAIATDNGDTIRLANAAAALRPGGAIYIVGGGILDDDRLGPPSAVYLNLTFLNLYPAGASYTRAQHAAWLEAAGCGDVQRITLPSGSGIIHATKLG